MNFSEYLLNEAACKKEACKAEACCKEEDEVLDNEFESIFDKDNSGFDYGVSNVNDFGVEEACCKESDGESDDDDAEAEPEKVEAEACKKEGCKVTKEQAKANLKEAFSAFLDSMDEASDEVTFGDVEKIEPVAKEGLDAAIKAEDNFVQAPDVADGYNAAEENLNNQVDAELEAAFEDNSGFESAEGEFVNPTIPAYNEEEDQYEEVETDEDLKKYADIEISDNELAESFTGWDDLD